MASFPLVALGDLFDFSSGLSKPASDFGRGNPFVTFKDVFYNYYLPEKLSSLVNTTPTEIARCSVLRGDVFLTRTSETMNELGMSSVALRDYPNATFNGFSKRLRPKQPGSLCPEYLAYAFRADAFRASVTAMSTLSTRASLNNEMLARLVIPLPGLSEQVAIGSVLHSLDRKIELNRRMASNLELTARTIFRSWFINFDPVHAKRDGRSTGLPAEIDDFFPDSFDDTEFGPVPRGWAVRSLDSLAEFLNGLALQKFPDTGGSTLPVIKIAQLRRGNTDGSDRCSRELPSHYVVEDGDILFSWSGSLECAVWTGGEGALNQHLFKVTPATSVPKWFIYEAIQSHLADFRSIAAGKATTMGHIQRHHLTAAVMPWSSDAVQAASGCMEPLFERTWRTYLESRTLANLRETLLPRLVSGELSASRGQPA